jgi:hypothetical protein
VVHDPHLFLRLELHGASKKFFLVSDDEVVDVSTAFILSDDRREQSQHIHCSHEQMIGYVAKGGVALGSPGVEAETVDLI